jgi:uncharacterized protein
MQISRATFLKRTLYTTGALALGNLLYAWQVEPHWLEFTQHTLPIKNLPQHLMGKTLLQISDLHTGARLNENFLINALKKAEALKPHFVMYTGDYVTLHQQKILYPQLHNILQHFVKGTLGTAAILGNHDYGVNFNHAPTADAITQTLQKYNIPVLRNSSINFSGLNIIGFDDYWGTNFNPNKALENYNPQHANLVLCHNPDVADLNVWLNYQGYILSGHTHGGQCKPPFLNAPILPVKNKKYSQGFIQVDANKTLYINRALGHSLQLRYNVRPEITVFTLQKS